MSTTDAWSWGIVVGCWLGSGYVAYCFNDELKQTPKGLFVYAVIMAAVMVGGGMAIKALEGK